MAGNITRRGQRSWRLKFEVGERDPVTGKRATRYVTVNGTKKDAQRELTRLLGQVDNGVYVEPSALTVAEYLERWLTDHAQHRVSAKTFERYAEIARKHLVPALGVHRLAKLSPLHIQAYYSEALTKGRVRTLRGGIQETLPPLAARTVKHHHRILSEALRQAVRLRLLQYNPCGDVDPPKPKRTEMKILDQARSAKLIRAVDGKLIYVPVLLAIMTGMRRGEILALRWRDLNLDGRTLQVTRTLEETATGIGFKEPKSERSRRSIALPTFAVEELRRHRRQQALDLLKLGIRQTDETLVCCDHEAHPLRPRSVTKGFADLSRKLGLGVRFHDLRHSHISHLLAAGVHPKVASERAGHASVSITLDVYSHLIPGMQEDAANRIDAALRTHLERRS
jgi:integrase